MADHVPELGDNLYKLVWSGNKPKILVLTVIEITHALEDSPVSGVRTVPRTTLRLSHRFYPDDPQSEEIYDLDAGCIGGLWGHQYTADGAIDIALSKKERAIERLLLLKDTQV